MTEFRRTIMWAALALIIALTVLSVYGAFIGAERAQEFFNRIPMAVYWAGFALALAVAIVVFPRLIRQPGMLLVHAGCILILAGGGWGSRIGFEMQKKLFGIDRIPKGQMVIYEGQTTNQVEMDTNKFLFSLGLEFEHSFHGSTIPKELQQEFEKSQAPLSQNATIRILQGRNGWQVADNVREYSVKKGNGRLNVYLTREMKELPFAIKLRDFRLEYYPINLLIQTRDGRSWKVPVEFGRQVSLGDDLGTITVVKSFENFKIGIEGGKNVPVDDPRPGSNPALEVLVTQPDGQMATKYIFELFPGHSGAEDKFLMSYRRMPRDYISELQVIRDSKVIGEKDIEVNHPLHYAGYHFYQSSYDAKAGQFTVLQVVSDSGLYIVYAGYWALCLGVIWHLWLRHVFSKIGAKKKTNGN